MRIALCLLFGVILISGMAPFTTDGTRLQPVAVEAEGVAEWRKPYEQAVREAIRDALLQAIESACGVRLARFEQGRDGVLQRSAQIAFVQGIVLRWQPLSEPRVADGCVRLRVRAEIVPVSQLQTADDWREVWQTVGHPPLNVQIRYAGEPAFEAVARRALQAMLTGELNAMGVRPLQSQMLHGGGVALDRAWAGRPGHWQLIADLSVEPLKRWGDTDAPYALGDLFASWKVRLRLQALAPGERTPTLLAQREASAISFTSDREAIHRAIRKAVTEPDSNWRTNLATLWIDQLLDRVASSSKPTVKEANDDAKRRTKPSVAAASNSKPAVPRAKRR